MLEAWHVLLNMLTSLYKTELENMSGCHGRDSSKLAYHNLQWLTCIKLKYDYNMAMVAITQLYLVLANCVLCTETDLEDKRRKNIKFLENIVHKCLYSKRKATKMFPKTLFRIESYLWSTTNVICLTCSTQHADFVLQHSCGRLSYSLSAGVPGCATGRPIRRPWVRACAAWPVARGAQLCGVGWVGSADRERIQFWPVIRGVWCCGAERSSRYNTRVWNERSDG